MKDCKQLKGKESKGKEPQGNVRILGNILNDKYGSGFSGNVYDANYYCPTLNTMQGAQTATCYY